MKRVICRRCSNRYSAELVDESGDKSPGDARISPQSDVLPPPFVKRLGKPPGTKGGTLKKKRTSVTLVVQFGSYAE